MKRLIVFLIVLSSMIGLHAQAQNFLGLRSDQITPEVIARIENQNRQLRSAPSFTFDSSPYNLPDAIDIANPETGRFKEDIPWTKDFSRHVSNPSMGPLFFYYSDPEHFTITQDPSNQFKLTFQTTEPNWNGWELMMLMISDHPLGPEEVGFQAIIRITVEPVADPPIFYDLPPNNTFYVNENDTLAVNFDAMVRCIDSPPLHFNLHITQTQMTLPYNVEVDQYNPITLEPEAHGHLLVFRPRAYWNGMQTMMITAVDRNTECYTTIGIKIVVNPINFPPEIISHTPTDLELDINQFDNQAFTVNAMDPDGDALTHEWTLVGPPHYPINQVISSGTSANYTFNVHGVYTLTYVAQDGEFQATVTWTINVKPVGPIFDPAGGGVFDHAINVTLTVPAEFAGATIYYTLDGNPPVPDAPGTFVYSDLNPIFIDTLENAENIQTITAIYVYDDGSTTTTSQVVSNTYRITGQVAALNFNLPGGTYHSAIQVIITCPNPGATIYYTTDGNDPVVGDPNTFTYTTPIDIPAETSMVIKAMGVRADWINSPTRIESYNVTGAVTITNHTMNPAPKPAGEYFAIEPGDPLKVKVEGISMYPPSATLYYTTDGSIPDPTNPNAFVYTPGFEIELDGPTTIKLRAFNPDWAPSSTYTYYYDVRVRVKILPFANGTVFDPIPGTYTEGQLVTLSTNTNPAGAYVYYTTDGSEPTEDATLLYTAPFWVNSTTTVKVKAFIAGQVASITHEGLYNITGQVATIQFTPAPASYQTPQTITISTSTPGATIYYTLDGSEPDESSNLYTGPLTTLSAGKHTIKARAYKTDWLPSEVGTGIYRFGILPDPIFSHAGGIHTSPITVTLSVPVEGAFIYYTTTGGEPGTPYSGGIDIAANQTVTISAIAKKAGWADSDIVTRTFTVTGQLAAPSFNPPASTGPFTGSIAVSIINDGSNPAGSYIKYTLDGEDPTESYGTVYTGSVTISSSGTLKARAFMTDWTPSVVHAEDYVITGTIATPIFTPAGGTYTGAVDVYITVNPPDANIYYTDDGTTPDATSIPYTVGTPITVDSSKTLKAIAYKTGWDDSAVGTADYVITGTVANPVIIPASGTYYSAQTVNISTTTPGATIHYTLDGSEPSDTHGTPFTAPFGVGAGVHTVKAIAFMPGWNDSAVTVANYQIIINPPVSTPSFMPPSGIYDAPINVTIHAVPSDADIYYTIDGSTPDATKTLYTGSIPVGVNTVIKAIAYKTGHPDSNVGTAQYTFGVANPSFSVLTGSYASAQNLTLNVSTPGADIRYTIDGTDPSDTAGTLYDGTPIVINDTTQPTVVKAIAYLTGWTSSDIVTHTYVINPPVAGPFFSVPSGDYYEDFTVSITAVPTVANIYYTIDGSEPSDTNGTLYSGPVLINANTTLKAKAYMVNYPASGVNEVTYDMHCSQVSFNPPQGTYTSNQLVSLSATPSDANIWYTTDGSAPVAGTSSLYDPANPILVDHNMTITAFAEKANWHGSSITSAIYIIDIPLPDVADLSITPPSGLYTSVQTVTISTPTPGATIRYTTDNSEPTLTNGTTYTAPFDVSTNTTVKARAFLAGHNPSSIAIAQYYIVIPVLDVEAPTFSPAAGVYNEPKLVSISTTTAGASIRYTTDGSDPSETHGTLYTDPINVNSDTTIKAIAFKAGMNPSQVVSSAYVINIIVPTVSAVSFSLPSGTYYLPQTLTLSTTTAGANIRYTTDGSDPTPTSGTLYNAAIDIPGNSRLFIKAIAYMDGHNPSVVTSANYLVTGTVADVTFSLPEGTYQTAQSVSLDTTTEDASIYYTTDGTNPTRDSFRYHQPIALPLNSTTQIKARAFKTDWLPSDIEDNTYIITGSIAFNPPVLDPAAGEHNNQITITISAPIPSDAAVYYTIDGTVPDASSTPYTAPFDLNADATINAVALKDGWTPAYISGTYSFKAADVTFTPAPGSYPNQILVSLSSATVGAQIRYTTDGSEPTATNGILYTAPITVSQNRTIKAYAFLTGYQDSEVTTAVYAIGSGIPMVATPVMNPQSGNYTQAQSVSITVSTPGATIRYTLNGNEPTASSAIYTGPIILPMNAMTTLKAKAFRNEWLPSATAVEVYNITGTVADVVFTPPAGDYTSAQQVVLTSATPGAYFRYTTDGSEPTASSDLYVAPIAVPLDATTTIKAKAYKAGWAESNTGTAIYNVTGTVALTSPVFTPAAGNYNAPVTVTISAPIPSDAVVRYTTDGSVPSPTNGTIYTAPILVDQNTTITAIAYKTNWVSSPVVSAAYTFGLPAPTFDPAPGLHQNQISININSSVTGAVIHYTTDGSNPATNGQVYSEAIVVPEGSTIELKAIATKAGWQDSPVTSGLYYVTGTVQDVTFNPVGGTYQEPVSVILSTATPEAVIRYTIDGTDPDETSAIYNTAIIVPMNSSVTIKAKAYKAGWIASGITEQQYNVTGSVIITDPVFSLPAGTYSTAQQVTINAPIPADATVYYTIDGTDPDQTSAVYNGAIDIPLNTVFTLKARAYRTDWDPSPVYTAVYNMTGQVQLPTAMFTPAAGTYQTAQTVTLAAATLPTDATLRYTLDGSEPSLSSAAYLSPIALPMGQTTTVKVKGFKDGWTPSETKTAVYNITGQLTFNTPVFDPAPGIYTTAQSVTINSTHQAGTTIRYTTNGSEPTASSPVYSAPIAVALNTNMTIKVKAFKTDWTPSVTHTAQYNVTGQLTIGAPVFTPAAGTYTSAQSVVIGAAQPASAGAVVRYTTDGTDPTPTSPVYSAPIAVSSSTQIKARAFATNWQPSEVYLANYNITGQVVIPEAVFTPPSGTYSTTQVLSINTPVPAGATIRYTMDGSEPTTSSQIYSRPIVLQLNSDIQVKAKAFLTDWIPSQTYTANYHMTGQAALSDPVFDPLPGIYTTAQEVEIVSSTIPAGGTIRYTIDGSDPDESSPIYSEPITVDLNSSLTIKARAYVTDWDAGEIITGIYHVTGQVQLPAAMFSPAAGTYQTAQSITLAAATLPTDATLRYTLDGSDPTENSPAYETPINLPLASETTIKVRGFKDGWITSEISSAAYKITGTLPAPVFSTAGGLYGKPPVVAITCDVAGATIHYTTDGSVPTQGSPVLAEGETLEIPPFTLNMVITAKAFKTDWIASAESSETYSVMEIPIDLRAFTYGGYIRVLWNLETPPTRGLQGFNIYRRALNETTFTKLNSEAIPLTQKIGNDWYFDDYGIQINCSYEYQVTAVYDGVESLPSSSTVVVYQSQELEISSASYAYPNPATNATRIRLVLTRNDNVTATVTIYDFAGKKVRTIAVPSTNSNLIEILWDLTNSDNIKVGRGTYFAKIVASDSVKKAEHVIKISVK